MGTAYNANIVTDGLVLCLDAANPRSYPLSGDIWYDLSGLNYNQDLTDGNMSSSNWDNGYFNFDGTSDYIQTSHGLIDNSDFSVCIWLNYLDTVNATRGILTTWNTSWNGFGLCTGTGSPGDQVRSWVGSGAGGMNWGSLSTVRDNFGFLVLTFTFSDKKQRGYINGEYKSVETRSISSVSHSSLQIARGGPSGSVQYSYCPNGEFKSSIIMLYTKALSPQEIRQNFNATRGRYGI